MSAPEPKFTRFPELPAELRRRIWGYCLPHRIVEIDLPRDDAVKRDDQFESSSLRNTQPPIITRVCRESRAVAFETGDVMGEDSDPHDHGQLPVGFHSDRWFDPARDTVHLHWDGLFDLMSPDTLNPILHFLWNVSKGHNEASITAGLMGGFQDNYSCPWADSNFDLLGRQHEFSITLHTVNIHVTLRQAMKSGLFGRLGEERVRLVSATDSEAILKYYQLWLAGRRQDSRSRAFFDLALSSPLMGDEVQNFRDDLETKWLRNKWTNLEDQRSPDAPPKENPKLMGLNSKADECGKPIDVWNRRPRFGKIEAFPNVEHPWVKKMLKEMPNFRPVIMFRFCEVEQSVPSLKRRKVEPGLRRSWSAVPPAAG